MANAIKWEQGWVSRSTVLTTELNSLAAASRTDGGSVIDNSSNLDQYGQLELLVTFGSTPAAAGRVDIYMVNAPDGTNYDDGSSTVDPGGHKLIASIPVRATTGAQRLLTPVFAMVPSKTKFILTNRCSVSFPASGSTLTLYTTNDEIQ